jgi:hypothetical protein
MDKIASGDADVVDRLLSADPALPRCALEAGATRADAPANFITEIAHTFTPAIRLFTSRPLPIDRKW